MTHHKRTHHLPEEEASTEEARDDSGSSAANDEPMTSGAQPVDEQDGDSIPSFQTADPTGDPDFQFSPLDDDQRDFEAIPLSPLDDEPIRTSGSRRRRRPNRLLTRPDVTELGERLESMARRSVPTFDFFFFSLLAGAILGFGFILDQPAILLFGVLTAPILAPWVGAALAAATGEIRFLGQTLGGFFTALFMVLITGILAGLASRIWMPITTE